MGDQFQTKGPPRLTIVRAGSFFLITKNAIFVLISASAQENSIIFELKQSCKHIKW